jgi:hypothetical protein
MEDELRPNETFSQRCYSRFVVGHPLAAHAQLCACVYRDFGAWRPVADYRDSTKWIKYASMETYSNRSEAERRADALVDELMRLLRSGDRNAAPGV